MHDDFLRRFCLAVLVLAGVLGIAVPPWADAAPGFGEAALRGGAELVAAQMRHLHVLQDLVGAGLVLAAFLPGLRAAALGAGMVSKLSYLTLAWGEAPLAVLGLEGGSLLALVAVALVLGRQARREALWDTSSAAMQGRG